MNNSTFKHFKKDFPASIIVFLVAVPLCLGIAVASGAPPLSGIIAGIIGGIIVGSLSNSPLGVSGPAAGLASIVAVSISDFAFLSPEFKVVEGVKVVCTQSDKIAYGFEIFLVSIIIGGIIQLILGFLKGGVVGYYFPNSVILGMLGGIGVTIFMKQMPNIIGIESDTSLTDIVFNFSTISTKKIDENGVVLKRGIASGAILICLLSVGILALWERPFMKRSKFSSLIQGPLVVVILGIVLNEILLLIGSDLALKDSNLISLPIADNLKDFKGFFAVPNFTDAFINPKVYVTGAVVALVASLETLLCLEATDKLDPDKRISDPNKELKAQGIGNILSGLIGGLPITQVIVRSSANIQSGGKTKLSAILHGFFVLASLVLFPSLLNKLPIASLAAILLMVGYKLAHPSKFKEMWRKGIRQFAPFIVTLLLIYYVDMLWGISIGLTIAIFIILYNNFRTPYFWKPENQKKGAPIILRLSENVTFLNKAAMLKTLKSIPNKSHVIIDATNNVRIDDDVKEIIDDFKIASKAKNIKLEIKGFDEILQEDSDKAYQKAIEANLFVKD
jgi:MFS superfamily sulfate permease-like transporter